MTFGKIERTVAVVVVVAGLAAAIHFLVFQQKAQVYQAETTKYKAEVEELNSAELIGPEQEADYDNFLAQTTSYESLVTSVVQELNLTKTVADASLTTGAVDRWASSTIQLLTQLDAQRNGNVQLTFLGQSGWNLVSQLPSVGGSGALADRANQLNFAYQQMGYARDVQQKQIAISNYNTQLSALGISPQLVSLFAVPWYNQYVFANDRSWVEQAARMSNSGGAMGAGQVADLRQYYNSNDPFFNSSNNNMMQGGRRMPGLLSFGSAVPALHKIWYYELIRRQLAVEDPNMTQLNAQSLLQFGEALDIGIPPGEDEPLNSINKQLQALLDIIAIAERSGVQEIREVRLLRPENVAKAEMYVPGTTPAPTATPAAEADPFGGMGMMGMMGPMDMGMMGMGMGDGGRPGDMKPEATPVPDAERVGTGAGIELFLVGDNASLVRFYYELSHVTRTYGLDDLYIYANNQGGYLTSATIEVITDVNLSGASQPVEGEMVQ